MMIQILTAIGSLDMIKERIKLFHLVHEILLWCVYNHMHFHCMKKSSFENNVSQAIKLRHFE